MEYFKITSVHRDDLGSIGFDTSNVNDDTMIELADKMKEAYLEQGFWIDLPILAEQLGILKLAK